MMKIYIVYSDDCNENDCGCFSESVDSIWFNKKSAEKRSSEVYHGRVESTFTSDKIEE